MTSASANKLKKKAADFEAKKQLDKALALYIQLLEESDTDLDDGDLQLYNRVGDLLTRQGNVAEALGWYEKAVDIYAERGFLNNAIALCNKVLRQSPSRAAVYYKLGKISASKGFKSDAKKNFIEYADRMQKAGQIDEAFRALKEFADLCPDQDDIRLMLAEWLTRENRKSEAVEQLETLWNKFESEGRRPEASATLGRMKALDPEFMPKASGAWVAQKSSDLVFLDLAVEAPAARAVSETPPNVKSRSPSPSAVPVVAALEGLTLMFHPDEEDVHGASHHPDGFQEADALQLVEPNESMAGLEAMELESTPDFGTDALAQMGLLPNADGPGASSEFAAHVAAIDGLTNAEPSAVDFVDGEVDGVENDERGGGRFISLDLDAVMAQPPRTQEIALEVDLPVLVPIDESTSSDAAHIDLLRILGTPIGTPAIALTPLESLAPLDLLDLGHDHPANDNVSASSVAPEDARSVASAADVDAAANEIEIVAADSHGHVTSELVAIDASARVTDELLVVETDEESDLADAHADLATDDAAAESSRASGGHGRMLDGDVTPDAWVEAALGSRRDDLTFDRLLTPLGVPVISAEIDPQDRIGSRSIEAPPLAVLPSDIEAAKAESHDFDEFGTLPKQVDEVSSESCSTVSFGLTNAGAESNAAAASTNWSHDPSDAADSQAIVDVRDSQVEASRDDGQDFDAAIQVDSGAAELVDTHQAREDRARSSDLDAQADADSVAQSNAAAGGEGSETIVPSAIEAFFGEPHGASRDINLLDELTPPFMRDAAVAAPVDGFTSGEVASALDVALPLHDNVASTNFKSADEGDPPTTGLDFDFDFAAADRKASEEMELDDSAESDAVSARSDSALDTASLRLTMSRDLTANLGEPNENDADSRGDAARDDARRPENRTPPDEAMIEAAFRDSPIDLPLLDVDSTSDSSDDETVYGTYDPSERATPESFLAQPPTFDADREDFEPEPALSPDTLSPDDWSNDSAPEVLIDGEWRDEHVGDLVSGEVSAVIGPLNPPARFDDLAAAMMWPADQDDHPNADEPQNGGGAERSMSSQSGTLSFGGVEAQLRRRLEIDPNNWALRRLLGEELIGLGQRESGLAELEMAMSGFEQLGDLDGARGVADSVLRAVPTSVRHHQKRVEYAVRSGNRTHLVDAYVELADALFRSGDAPKASVVYSRVLELSPSNQRARIALGLVTLADETAPPTTEKYGPRSIAPGTMTGLFASAAPSPNAGGSVTEDMPSIADVTIPRSASTAGDFRSSETTATESSHATSNASNEKVRDGSRATPTGQPRPVDATTQRPAPPTAPPAFVPNASSNEAASESTDESFVDLGDWLRASEPVRSTRMVTRDVTPSGDEQADFDDMLRRFKQGIAENVDEEDFASHYDLGVAYKEMGLTDEAISEFQKALRGDDHRERSYEALGQCFVEKGQMQVAITLLRRAVESTGSDDQQLVGVLYLLGFANEAMERHRDALGYYQRVFAVDIEFRDVAKRVAAMEHRTK